MYKIIGGDHREYGPCDANEVRRWFREGRLNAQSLIRAEGSTEWKPLATFPEFAPLLGDSSSPSAPPPIGPTIGQTAAPSAPAPIAELERRDYDVDIFGCLSRGWELMQKHFWPVLGISLLVLLASGAVDQIIWTLVFPSVGTMLVNAIMNPSGNDPFTELMSRLLSPENTLRFELAWMLTATIKPLFLGGLFFYYLKLIRGQKAELGDAFSGFRLAAVQLLLFGLVKTVLVGVGLALCALPGIYLLVVWAFSVPLMIDRQMNFWAAMELSRKVVSKHWFVICGLVLVYALVGALGELACCLQYVTMPIAFLATLYAYEDIFGQRATRPA